MICVQQAADRPPVLSPDGENLLLKTTTTRPAKVGLPFTR